MTMTSRVAIDKITRKGQHLLISISTDANWVQVEIDGKQVASRAGYGKAQAHNLGVELIYQIGAALLTAEEAKAIDAAREAQLAEYRQTPDGLKDTRQSLARNITAILDEIESARERAFNRDTGNIPSYDTPAYREAKAALDRFDVEHPEIVTLLKKEKEELVARHMWD